MKTEIEEIFETQITKKPTSKNSPNPIKNRIRQPNTFQSSKLFTATNALNPLIQAATPILTIATRINKLPENTDYEDLSESLIHEIEAFESQAQKFEYDPNTVLAARYCLCALLDDLILQSKLEPKHQKSSHILWHFHSESINDAKAIAIIQRCQEEPKKYLDALELMYLILSLGFEGNLRHDNQGYKLLQQTRNDIYHQIRGLRGAPEAPLPVHIEERD